MCDMRIASDTATFAESFAKVGIIPGDGGAFRRGGRTLRAARDPGPSRPAHRLARGHRTHAPDSTRRPHPRGGPEVVIRRESPQISDWSYIMGLLVSFIRVSREKLAYGGLQMSSAVRAEARLSR